MKKCGQALSVLRSSIQRDFIDHIKLVESPKGVGEILEKLFAKRSVAQFQMLENELADTTQGNMSILQYFHKVRASVLKYQN